MEKVLICAAIYFTIGWLSCYFGSRREIKKLKGIIELLKK